MAFDKDLEPANDSYCHVLHAHQSEKAHLALTFWIARFLVNGRHCHSSNVNVFIMNLRTSFGHHQFITKPAGDFIAKTCAKAYQPIDKQVRLKWIGKVKSYHASSSENLENLLTLHSLTYRDKKKAFLWKGSIEQTARGKENDGKHFVQWSCFFIIIIMM